MTGGEYYNAAPALNVLLFSDLEGLCSQPIQLCELPTQIHMRSKTSFSLIMEAKEMAYLSRACSSPFYNHKI